MKCMEINFGWRSLSSFGDFTPFCFPSKTAKISLQTMDSAQPNMHIYYNSNCDITQRPKSYIIPTTGPIFCISDCSSVVYMIYCIIMASFLLYTSHIKGMMSSLYSNIIHSHNHYMCFHGVLWCCLFQEPAKDAARKQF